MSIGKFWTNIFNTDYHDKYDAYSEVPEISDYLTWSYFSKQNPMFVFYVKWIKHQFPLGVEIENQFSGMDCGNLVKDFEGVSSLFTRPPVTKNTGSKFAFSSNSIFLERREIATGETLKLKSGKEIKIHSFLSLRGGEAPTHMQVIDNKQKTSRWKLKPAVYQFLKEQLFDEDKVFSSIKLQNGEIITVGDVVLVNYPCTSYKKVEDIRLGIDGKLDVKLSSRQYLAANLDAKVVDLNGFNFRGVKLVKGHNYVLSLPQGGFLPVSSFKIVKFTELNIERFGELSARFKQNSRTFDLSLEEDGNKIHEQNSLTPVSTFRLGTGLFANEKANTILLSKGGVLLHEDEWKLEFNSEVAKADILKNKGEIEVKAFDLDIHFKVGDKVVIADWMDPSQMLKIHRILGFTLNSDNILHINIKHRNEERSVPYIDFNKGRISTGLIRQITNQYNGIKAGTKIRSKLPGISGFPMKDINIIIGFVTDTGGPPLVLCSNCYTLWPFDLEKFEIILRSSHIWKKLEHAPMKPGHAAFQSGDMFIHEEGEVQRLYILYLARFNNLSALCSEDFIKGLAWSCTIKTFESSLVSYRYGLYTPRYTQTQLREFNKLFGFPNYHGLFTKMIRGANPMGFKNDRRIFDV